MRGKARETFVFADPDSGGSIHVANIKGGVGKTTVATNLAASLSMRGPTLIIDLDVQGSASAALGKEIAGSKRSSWELFHRRFCPSFLNPKPDSCFRRVHAWFSRLEAAIFSQFVGKGAITTLVVNVQENLDLIPANSELFKAPTRFQLHNFIFNLRLLRRHYKYVILDTPSVWNKVTQFLYRNVDLNLIPVTLNALSTKSLRDYLSNVRTLVQHHPRVRIRIVKNEVYGKQDSKIKGKIRTMNENRRFLENLCEQAHYKGKHGVSSLPQSIIFDLEIPESAIVLDAQDEGKLLAGYHQHCAAAKAFEQLAQRVQYVLNMPVFGAFHLWGRFGSISWAPKLAAVGVLAVIFSFNDPVPESAAPRPVAPQQLSIPEGGLFYHTFSRGESLIKVAKFAISWFRAKVPSQSEIQEYVQELVTIYNLTRLESEPKLHNANAVPEGIRIGFFPPSNIVNQEEKELVPVYRFFMKITQDSYSYITGDWCERGTGGGQPHYGIDVAAIPGSKIVCPVSGTAVLKTDSVGGRTVGVQTENEVLFFCHMDERVVKSGDLVKQGDTIGTVGNTGRSTGPHVHVGYAVRSQSRTDISFGKYRYVVTDPKLFYYRKVYVENLVSAFK